MWARLPHLGKDEGVQDVALHGGGQQIRPLLQELQQRLRLAGLPGVGDGRGQLGQHRGGQQPGVGVV